MDKKRFYRGLANVLIYLVTGLAEIARGNYVLSAVELLAAMQMAWLAWGKVPDQLIRRADITLFKLFAYLSIGALAMSLLGFGHSYLAPYIGKGWVNALFIVMALTWAILFVRADNKESKTAT